MITARNMNQVNQLLMKKIQQAMKEVQQNALSDMQKETARFYEGTQPTSYHRTGALGQTPRVSDLTSSKSSTGGKVSFNAYLDDTHQYTTGRQPTMRTILTMANQGGSMKNPPMAALDGNPGFWDRSKEEIERELKQTMTRYFG